MGHASHGMRVLTSPDAPTPCKSVSGGNTGCPPSLFLWRRLREGKEVAYCVENFAGLPLGLALLALLHRARGGRVRFTFRICIHAGG